MIRNLILICLVTFLGTSNLTAQDFEYIGAKKCKMCHNKPNTGAQYKIWAGSVHAKAMESLKGDEKTNPKCIKCHSTYGSVNADLIKSLKIEEGVSCESCHGPGSKYFPSGIMKNSEKALAKGLIMPTKEVCIKCHNEESPNFKGFNFEEYAKKIAHPNPSK